MLVYAEPTPLATAIKIVHEHMLKWPLYRPEHKIDGHRFGDNGRYWLGYRTAPHTHTHIKVGTTHWDLNVTGDVCYLLYVYLVAEDRGKGYGGQLYEIIIDIARSLGCREIRQTSSGHTAPGESRRSYLMRRGWLDDGAEVFKLL